MEKQVPSTPNPETSRGVYGFVMSMGFCLLITLYFVWLVVPTSMAKSWTYEPPQKYWALAVPIFFATTLFLFAFCIYPAMHSRHDGELHEENAFRDKYSIENHAQMGNGVPLFGDDEQTPLKQAIFLQTSSRGKSKRSRKKSIRDVKLEKPIEEMLFSNLKLYDEENLLVKSLSKRKIPSATDLDLSQVCKLLYMKKA